MSACLVTMLCAIAGYVVFLASSLCAIGDLTTWSEAVVVDLLLPGAEQRLRNGL
jgi:hypothetical protein